MSRNNQQADPAKYVDNADSIHRDKALGLTKTNNFSRETETSNGFHSGGKAAAQTTGHWLS